MLARQFLQMLQQKEFRKQLANNDFHRKTSLPSSICSLGSKVLRLFRNSTSPLFEDPQTPPSIGSLRPFSTMTPRPNLAANRTN